ncbi:valine--tRNA ligase [Parasphingopyxis algicola]|uniref:valine--tRNA ligase n=1 Tax=Parasphingopyxis algicola TaxID=2026624 RepID=UPI0015A4067A|nr:valine--tRNA ligase [Parasphingopyxis algicola]QLC24015.1 valine--tRNA ligase [Parasphingopyxis algicola]
MSELPKHFDPAAIEARWYAHWEEERLFRPDRPEAEPWTIVNPPPNVTGSLHIGHALDNTLQDILVRHQRLLGKDALWVVGTDHAGIATQMVVERQLMETQQKRTDFSREEFVEKVWEWKEESGGEITQQLRRLGCSMDWSNERFTMDPGFTKAVTKVFVDLYNDGLIYRDKRLVNWDPGLKTAISDLEVENSEINGHFWHFSYPLEDGSGAISVATTRPETMLADMAVAVHPSDERYADIVGKNVRLPITGRLVPVITDEHADPELGSGAVKITPGHDFNDFDVGKRAGFEPAEMLNMLDAEAQVVQAADGLIPDALLGMDRFDARKKVVEMIEAEGLLEQVEDRVIVTPYGDRSNAVIEPWLTDQWYVDAEKLAVEPMAKVRSGEIDIVPKSWEKTFFNWMENIQPWCVSRQLWWGHRIPAWYGPDRKTPIDLHDLSSTTRDEVFVAATEEALLADLRKYYGADKRFEFLESEEDYLEWDNVLASHQELRETIEDLIPIFRDDDVLDTWFSSALWPFATLGWPDDMIQEVLPLDGGGLGGGDPSARDTGSGEITPPQTPPHQGEGLVARPGSDLARHYPNDVLISGFDILFFWDARMMMQGLHLMGEVPFKTLYLHGLVRAADGQKMSKSKGNTVDPLGLIDKYGADALRFFMAAMESQGRDIKMDEKRVEGYRNFATKLWNAARFCQANGIGASTTLEAPEAELPVNRWIISETVETLETLNKAFDDLRFDGAADAIYHFVWDKFCDLYIERAKDELNAPTDEQIAAFYPDSPRTNDGEIAQRKQETKLVAGWVLDQVLVMLHPFMPFITEELWHAMGERGSHDIIVARWPSPEADVDQEATAEMEAIFAFGGQIRSARSELNISPSVRTPAQLWNGSEEWLKKFVDHTRYLNRVARLGQKVIRNGNMQDLGPGIQVGFGDATIFLPLEGVIDLDAEKARLTKSLEAAQKEAGSLDKRLSNPQFVEKAKPEAVEKARADHAEKAAEAERLKAALERLG